MYWHQVENMARNPEKYRSVFTTGQVATMMRVNPRTVSKWCDSGRLGHYKIPDSQDRRIPFEDLRAFIVKHNFPTSFLLDVLDRVVVAGNSVLAEQLRSMLPPHLAIDACLNAFDLGQAISRKPLIVVLDALLGSDETMYAAVNVIKQNIPLVLIQTEDRRPDTQDWNGHCKAVLISPVDPKEVWKIIKGVVEK